MGNTGPAGPAGAGLGTNSFSTLLVFGNDGPPNESANTTYYLTPIGNLTDAFTGQTSISSGSEDNFITAPASCTMKALNLAVTSYYAAASDTTSITVYANGAATSMHASVATSSTTTSAASSDTTHTFAVTAGETISIAFSETNVNPYNKITVGLICQ